MKTILLMIIFLTSAILFGCTNSIDENQLRKKNGIAYEVDSDEPYTGKVTSSSNQLGAKTETYYHDGIKHGTQTAWYKNGQIKAQVEFVNGKRHGIDAYWYENGQKLFQKEYQEDRFNGSVISWYENGEIKTQMEFVNGKRHGIENRWYGNGQKKSQEEYVNGMKHGIHTRWYENGQKKTQVKYVNRLPQGEQLRWDKNGKKLVDKLEFAPSKNKRSATRMDSLGKALEPLAKFFGAIAALSMAENNARKKRFERLGTSDPKQPPKGPWKDKYWCWTDFKADSNDKPTFCYDQNGGLRMREGLTDPCNGAEGWCDGYGLGPKPGFNQ